MKAHILSVLIIAILGTVVSQQPQVMPPPSAAPSVAPSVAPSAPYASPYYFEPTNPPVQHVSLGLVLGIVGGGLVVFVCIVLCVISPAFRAIMCCLCIHCLCSNKDNYVRIGTSGGTFYNWTSQTPTAGLINITQICRKCCSWLPSIWRYGYAVKNYKE